MDCGSYAKKQVHVCICVYSFGRYIFNIAPGANVLPMNFSVEKFSHNLCNLDGIYQLNKKTFFLNEAQERIFRIRTFIIF